MVRKTVAEINQYEGTTVNPIQFPEQVYELYSVPSFDTEYPEIIAGADIGSSKVTVQEGDVLICKINPRINRVWVVKHNTEHPLLASSEWIVVRNPGMDSDYLRWYFSSPTFRTLLNSEVAGIGGSLTRAQPKRVAQYTVPICPFEEQQRISTSLNQVESLISLRKQQIAKLDELVKAQFVEMFDGIHDRTKYPYVTIDSFTSVMSGGTPDRGIPEYWTSGTIRWVKTTELQNCVIHDTEEHITQEGLDNSSAKLIPAGSILIAMYGQGKTRGMTGFLAVESTTNQACACILPSSAVNQTYLWQYMILSYDKLRDMAKGGNQPNLNAGIIKAFPVLMPPMELQNQFAALVAQTDQQKLTIQQSLDKLELLKKALMQKYFG